MPGITISKKLIKRLPIDEQEGLEDYLWSESGGNCFLCERKMNRAADEIEADHDQPVAEDGDDSRDNLHLTHQSCNRAKKNNPSVEIRPYLTLRAFLTDKGNQADYADCTEHFAIKPKHVSVEKKGAVRVKWQFSDGSEQTATVHKESNDEGEFDYCFVNVPREALTNDDECQPRNIKIGQIWAIYVDLKRNPLHEPPGCRLRETKKKDHLELLMFDGQHKTVASWMRGYERITVKVYLSITKDQTIHLVNSVQAKIKKLPLSPFELAAKMAEEWREHWDRYEEQQGHEKASEAGFIAWLPKEERKRGKQALEEAILQAYMDSDDLQLLNFVHRAGTPKDDDKLITEAAFKNKLLKKMVRVQPLEAVGEDLQRIRELELSNICRVVNLITQEVFEISKGGGKNTDKARERRRRFVYQSSLSFVADLARCWVAHVLVVDEDAAFIEKKITGNSLKTIKSGVGKIASHPVWSVDLSTNTRRQKTFKRFGERIKT